MIPSVCCAVHPAYVTATEGQQICTVCHDVANGVHFGVVSCEGCKVSNGFVIHMLAVL